MIYTTLCNTATATPQHRGIKDRNTMTPIFEREISVYRNAFDNVGSVTTLGAFLCDRSHDAEIAAIRREPDAERQKQMKKTLPAAAISGTFAKRGGGGLLQHSGLICIDIDGKDNEWIAGRWDELKQQLSRLPQVAYAGLSVRGNGLFCIIPILYAERHTAHFRQLQEDFRKVGITIDKGCGDVCRMRIISYDPQPIINPNAKCYERFKSDEKPLKMPYNRFPYAGGTDDSIGKVMRLCAVIDAHGIDLTADYDSWVKVGCSLASLGDAGREPFHVCSRQSDKYNPDECNKKFDNLMRTTSRFTIATFFYICKGYGITEFPY